MTRLTRFYYHGRHNSRTIQSVFHYIGKYCCALEELGFRFDHENPATRSRREMELPAKRLNQLRSLAIAGNNECYCTLDSAGKFYQGLLTSKELNLRDVYLEVCDMDGPVSFFAELFNSAFLPNLERLVIDNSSPDPLTVLGSLAERIKAFLSRHQTLQALTVSGYWIPHADEVFSQEPNFLPNLRALKLRNYPASHSPFVCPANIARRLSYYGSPVGTQLARRELESMPNLKGGRLAIGRKIKFILWKLAKKIPLIEKLDCRIYAAYAQDQYPPTSKVSSNRAHLIN
ncbi:hypothetical protein M422DRAFT_44679 [Sphaerobolus stellatus SS14]|nr:hypothetical protein M422DRAFT_44679 [Sphaerobolus stellatus SS14]